MSNSFRAFVACGLVMAFSVVATFGQSSHFDVNNMDTKASACTDFYQYANGGWIAKNEIPPAPITTSHRSPASPGVRLSAAAVISPSNSRVIFKTRSGSESELCTNPIIFGTRSDLLLKSRIRTRFP